ncbi:carboxymuconolactone decarboxylase family protein [Rhizosphaericola mali]|uniref:Alkyl hydroperoxide reductase AhpD n=1 Tax=Rhizosphaericola mali TaxID=2545455 RepID=A0A5P2G9M2_9BACT|nr:carboxymuconolactone decarboxylase family protein [Rhizosphaericola mali]QES90642.1 alkylhydroperoxidase [Rhizosphaericola mali]
MAEITNETLVKLLETVKVSGYEASENAQTLIDVEARYLKDLKINVGNVINNTQYLNKKEAALLALATAINEKSDVLKKGFTELAKENGATAEELAEVVAATSLMNANNVFYRFRHFVNKDSYNSMPAGIKMSIMMNPVLGKEFFELLSLAVSSLNGCEMCVTSHEASVRQHGGSEQRIFEAVKLVAIIRSFVVVLS